MKVTKCDLCGKEIPIGEGEYKMKLYKKSYIFPDTYWVRLDICDYCKESIILVSGVRRERDMKK